MTTTVGLVATKRTVCSWDRTGSAGVASILPTAGEGRASDPVPSQRVALVAVNTLPNCLAVRLLPLFDTIHVPIQLRLERLECCFPSGHAKDEFVPEREIGRGRFGTVYLCRNTASGEKIVDKQIVLQQIPAEHRQILLSEIAALEKVAVNHHVNIVSYLHSFQRDRVMHIYMEYCNGGDLCSAIESHRNVSSPFREQTVRLYLEQLAAGLNFIHRNKIIHRDLKPANIVLADSERLKITDFGVSALLNSSIDLRMSICGTPLYMAPEVINGREYNRLCDIWSLGVIVYEMVTLDVTFESIRVLASERVFQPSCGNYSQSLRDLIAAMVNNEATVRPESQDILKMDFIANVWEGVEGNDTGNEFTHQSLIDACYLGNMLEVRSTLRKGADIQWANQQGATALMVAVARGHIEVVRELVGRGARVNRRGINGRTALHFAANNGNHELITLLVEHGASINAADSKGHTPLHLAALNGRIGSVATLIKSGANVRVRQHQGMSPLQLAQQNNHSDVVNLLIQHGAQDTFVTSLKETVLCYLSGSKSSSGDAPKLPPTLLLVGAVILFLWFLPSITRFAFGAISLAWWLAILALNLAYWLATIVMIACIYSVLSILFFKEQPRLVQALKHMKKEATPSNEDTK